MTQLIAQTSESYIANFSARRSQKQNKHNAPKLNLVSLMDIFTILVFFLMVNTGDVEVLQPDENVILPKSFADSKPNTAPVIKVSGEHILFRDEVVASVTSLGAELSSDTLIQPLYDKLLAVKTEGASGASSSELSAKARSITVMGDSAVSYALLKRVLYTCAQADYRDVSLAVEYVEQAVASSTGAEA